MAGAHRFNRNRVRGKGILLIWRGLAVLTGGGREKGSPVNLAGPRHLYRRGIGGKGVCLGWRPPAIFTGGRSG